VRHRADHCQGDAAQPAPIHTRGFGGAGDGRVLGERAHAAQDVFLDGDHAGFAGTPRRANCPKDYHGTRHLADA
jgi:hypothetical protein